MLSERLNTLSQAAKVANTFWATAQVMHHLTAIERLLPYNPDLPDGLKAYLMHAHCKSTDEDTMKWLQQTL